jgi:hypothetical protein
MSNNVYSEPSIGFEPTTYVPRNLETSLYPTELQRHICKNPEPNKRPGTNSFIYNEY